MESREPTIDARLAMRLKRLRTERGLTLEGLAERSGVSRSMISLVERGESSPTAAVLDRLAAGLDVTIAALFADAVSADASPLARRADQPVWRDPGTGYVRRNLSPPGFPSPLELVEVVLPPAARVAYDTPGRAVPVHQHIYVLEGALAMTVGNDRHVLAAGDCLAMRLDRPIAFHNPGDQPARYLVALASEAAPGGPRR
ncbi:helix-turn-helix domain-containing protein [Azospirillum sp. ST 5-10]|uniref:helix-turn-helix domain-containing protein n=1 Tax=unclassified Azospirillum TaxID=2630922 RepID=UPI003F49BAA0